MKLTPMGRLAAMHGAMTPPKWWQQLFKETDRLNEEDEELGLFMLDERIAGMQELRRNWYAILNETTENDGE